MLIELLVRTTPGRGPKAQWDVIVAKQADRPDRPAIWGDLEAKVFQVAAVDTALLPPGDMADRFTDLAKRLAADPHGVIVRPFAERDAELGTIRQSTIAVDFDALTDEDLKRDVKDQAKRVPPIEHARAAPVLKTRSPLAR